MSVVVASAPQGAPAYTQRTQAAKEIIGAHLHVCDSARTSVCRSRSQVGLQRGHAVIVIETDGPGVVRWREARTLPRNGVTGARRARSHQRIMSVLDSTDSDCSHLLRYS
jgi:hypothetical protein